MINTNLSRSITEVLEILKHMDKKYTEKLPEKFMKFLQDNQDTYYISKFDSTKNLKDYVMHKETKALLGIIYLKYWSCQEQKNEYWQILEDNQKRYMAKINKKYNSDNLFKDNNKCKEKNQMIEYKESVFRRIINKIKLFLKLK